MFVPRPLFHRSMCWHYLLTLSYHISINRLWGFWYSLNWLISLLIFRTTVSKVLFIRMDFNQSTTSVIQVVLWPPPLRLPLLRHHPVSHWSETIPQCEPIRSVGAGYTYLLFKHCVPHAVFFCVLLLQTHSAESRLLFCILIQSRCWL